MTAQVRASVDPAAILDQAIVALKTPGAELPFDDVDRALQVAPLDPRLWHIKGLMHRLRDRRELAIPALRRAADLAPNEPLIVHGLARTLLEAGLPSVEIFARAMKLAPQNPEVVRGMVAALMATGDTAAAIEGLEIALSRQPLWVDGHILLAELRWSQGERQGFARSFDRSLNQYPTSVDLRGALMTVLLHAEQFDEVLSRIDEVRSLVGGTPLFALHEATARSEMGETAAADRLFDELTAIADSNTQTRRVRHLLRSGRPREAAEALEPWLTTSEQDTFWPYAASAWRLTGDPRSDWLEGDDRLVGVYDISDRLPPLDRLAETLRKLHVSKSEFFSQSVRGGTQTDGNLFHRIEPEIVALREAIRETVADYARGLPPIDPTHPLLRSRPEAFQFNGAWSVRLVAGGHHSNHVHPMGWLSSAFYVVLPADLGQNEAGWLTLGEPQAQLKLDLPPRRTIEPKPGRLALFPSWMWHGTRSFGEGERMTVAFDVARGS